MNAVQINFADFVQIQNTQPVTTSKFVAAAFGKRHDNVLAKIEEILTQVPDYFNKLNFKEIEFLRTNALGKTIRDKAYQLTKDGFMLLVMGFTGKQAMQIKIAYIEAFNAMAEKLANISGGLKPQTASTVSDRTGLRQAVSAVVGKHHIDYSTAYSLVHQRFNVESIEDLTYEQLGEAVKYCHALILDKSLNGEVLEKPQLPTQSAANFTNIQLQNMACLTYYSAWAMAILRKYSKPLRELGVKEAVNMWTLADESQSRIRSSREALESIVPQLEPYTADYICACFKDLDRMKREFGY